MGGAVHMCFGSRQLLISLETMLYPSDQQATSLAGKVQLVLPVQLPAVQCSRQKMKLNKIVVKKLLLHLKMNMKVSI